MQIYTYTVTVAEGGEQSSTSFNVLASGQDGALEWGDKLARRMCSSKGRQMIHSEVSAAGQMGASLPMVIYGHYATDEEIGW